MEELRKALNSYKEKNSLKNEDIAKMLNISLETLEKIESSDIDLEVSEINRIKDILNSKLNTSRKAVKILDLIFRFAATIMALVVIILSIYNFNGVKTLITLLAIGVACLSMTTLPKIEK